MIWLCWHLRGVLDVLYTSVDTINIKFNAKKTLCMIFNPTVSRKVVTITFLHLLLVTIS